ncbi:MAG: NUDIX hydrolase [Tuberibacillus sp.]
MDSLRHRGRAVIIADDQVVLIKRVRDGKVYYVFPGGGIEEGETPEQATVREAYEELGVKVKIKGLLDTVKYQGIQYFFLAEIINGEIGPGLGEEYKDSLRKRGTYTPIWINISDFNHIDVKPKVIADKVIDRYKDCRG